MVKGVGCGINVLLFTGVFERDLNLLDRPVNDSIRSCCLEIKRTDRDRESMTAEAASRETKMLNAYDHGACVQSMIAWYTNGAIRSCNLSGAIISWDSTKTIISSFRSIQ